MVLRIISTILALSLMGCSVTLESHYKTLQLAFATPVDQLMDLESIKSSSVEVAYIKSGERPWATIAKLFDENGMEKWISADKAMLVMSDGHIVKTIGFTNDLLYVSDLEKNPLKQNVKVSSHTWQRRLDWSKGEYGYLVNSRFSSGQSDSITILGRQFNTIHVREELAYASDSNTLYLDRTWTNHYWFDAASGVLLKTSQKQAPFSETFEIEFASMAVKLMEISNG